jgi:dihydroorotate dehydrogenase
MYRLIQPWLFRLDPERAHGLTIHLMRLAGSLPGISGFIRGWFNGPELPVEIFGLRFKNPVGLAAGYDKDALAWRGLACLGFGHLEIGTVTLHPQPGNPKPRIFRLPEDQAVINRMGFPGQGAAKVARRIKSRKPGKLVLGVNIGKNKDTPNEQADQDYLSLQKIFTPLTDYLVINVSSPNTLGLRRLQARDALEHLLAEMGQQRIDLEKKLPRKVPILVKLAPDLSDDELDDALAAIQGHGMDGVIATNTTVSRPGLRSTYGKETGGLSGKPLFHLSIEMVRKIVQRTHGRLPVIGVGGIITPNEAQLMLDAGASLIQVYTGLIYSGPSLVRKILEALHASQSRD